MRARLNDAELRATALGSMAFGTISFTNAWRAGVSNAPPVPNRNASTYTCQVCTQPNTASTPSTAAVLPMANWVTISTLRFEKRSAITPAMGENSRIGRNCRPVVMPSAPALPVSVRTSQSWATRCIQVPTFDTSEPVANRR